MSRLVRLLLFVAALLTFNVDNAVCFQPLILESRHDEATQLLPGSASLTKEDAVKSNDEQQPIVGEEHRFLQDQLLTVRKSLTDLITNRSDQLQSKIDELDVSLKELVQERDNSAYRESRENTDVQGPEERNLPFSSGQQHSENEIFVFDKTQQPVEEDLSTEIPHVDENVLKLHQKSSEGNVAAVYALIKPGVNVDGRDANGSTALHGAAASGQDAVLMELLKYGAEVNVTDKYGYTALYRAAANGHASIVTTLIAKEADVNAQGWFGFTALHRAAEHGYHDVVSILLQHGASNIVNSVCGAGQTALHLAAANGQSVVLADLIQSGASINAVDNHGQTALFKAVEKGSLDAVKALLGVLGASASVDMMDKNGATPLFRAVEKGTGSLDIVNALLGASASVDMMDKSGATALFKAVEKGSLEVVNALLGASASVAIKYKRDATIFHVATRRAQNKIIARLLIYSFKECGDAYNNQYRSWNGYPPERNFSLIMDIQDVIPSLRQWKDNGQSVDAFNRYVEVINMKDASGQTPLHVAVEHGQLETVNLLCKTGAAVNETDDFNSTALHIAIASGHSQLITALLAQNASVNVTNKNGRNALHEAAVKGQRAVVDEILKASARMPNYINFVDNDGHTALHLAAMRGQVGAVTTLLLHGADPSMMSNVGLTARDLAVQFHRKSAVAVLNITPPY